MLGVCYYPEHWPEDFWAEDARRMRELGVAYVRIGEFAWSRYEPRRGEFHWGWLDQAIEALGDAGLKIVLGTPTATPPKWLMDEHPGDRAGRRTGPAARVRLAPALHVLITSLLARKRADRRGACASVMAAIRRSPAGRPTTNTAATTPCCRGARRTSGFPRLASTPLSIARTAQRGLGSFVLVHGIRKLRRSVAARI